MAIDEDVYCTLVMSDAYLPGAAVLAHSLRDCGTTRKLAVLVTPDTLRRSTLDELANLYDYVLPIERLATPNPKNLYLMNRADLLFTFTKINLWRQIQFRKIVYIDADVVALRAPDELFALPDSFAAAPDVGWPDAFNSGVMVLSPNMGDYWALKTLAGAGDSFDGADQGLLNQYYEHKPWKRLSFTYNCTPSANYQYEPAYRYYKNKISMVHFIGEDKPWKGSRRQDAPPSAYSELSARWWAVYDKHFKVSTTEYSATGRREPVRAVQAQVKSEQQRTGDVYYATGYPVEITQGAPPPPEATVNTTEMPFTEPGEPAENIDQGVVEPAPTVEVRRFTAPQMEWDATRAAPPAESKPEAANFPTEQYQFSTDHQPWQPPRSYPEPPKDMWFEIPKEKPKKHEKPPPIFPWEEREVPAPTRTFVEDQPPSPEPSPQSESPPFTMGDEFAVTAEGASPVTPTINIQEEPWAKFGSVNKNAWDEDKGIDQYVRALTAWQKNRGKPSSPTEQQRQQQEQVLSPTKEPDVVELVGNARQRRESLLLTDFPTAIERPSLPVTPAPRRRSTFWGEEREEGMPPAEGVPNQADWDPNAQLESLRRHSLIGPSDLQLPSGKSLPERQMPASSAPVDPGKLGHPVALTRGAEEGSAVQSTNGGAAERSQTSVSSSQDTHAQSSEEAVQQESTSSAGGLFSARDFAQSSEQSKRQDSTSSAGGLFSARDFAQPVEQSQSSSTSQTSRGVSFGSSQTYTSNETAQQDSNSSAGGLFSAQDFAQPAEQYQSSSTSQTSRGVSFGPSHTYTSDEAIQESSGVTSGGSFSARDFAQSGAQQEATSTSQSSRGVSFASSETFSSSESHESQETTTGSTAGGLFSVPDFAQTTETREEEILSPKEAGPGAK